MNVLLTPIGRRGYLAAAFKDALQDIGLVITADMSPYAAGSQSGDHHVSLPACDDPAYLSALERVCLEHEIRMIFPLHDLEAYRLSLLRHELPASVQVFTLTDAAAEQAWDKVQTAALAGSAGLRYPQTVVSRGHEALVVVKPRFGSASVNTSIVSLDSPEFEAALGRSEAAGVPVVVQEFIKGREFGLDVIGDIYGSYAGCLVREKLRMRAGETDAARIHSSDLLDDVARGIHAITRHAGLIDCDLILNGDDWYLIDVNPRFGGGYPLSHAAGADVPGLLVASALGERVRPEHLAVHEGAVVAKQDSAVLVAFD